MNTVKINLPEGYEATGFNASTSEITIQPIKPKDVKERIKTVADVLADHSITQKEFDKQNESLEPDEVAYRIIKLLVKSLNEGWTPDWDNNKYDKYFPWFYMQGGSGGFRYDDCGGWHSVSAVGSRLCFKSEELAKYAANQFRDVYKTFMLIK